MNKPPLTSVVTTAALVLGVGGVVPAHAAKSGGLLDPVAGATNVYGLTCPVGTRSVRARVNEGNTAGVQLSVQVIDPGGRATTASAVDNGLSAFAVLTGRAGTSLVTVHNNNAAGEGYPVRVDCHDGNGDALEAQAIRAQNQ